MIDLCRSIRCTEWNRCRQSLCFNCVKQIHKPKSNVDGQLMSQPRWILGWGAYHGSDKFWLTIKQGWFWEWFIWLHVGDSDRSTLRQYFITRICAACVSYSLYVWCICNTVHTMVVLVYSETCILRPPYLPRRKWSYMTNLCYFIRDKNI